MSLRAADLPIGPGTESGATTHLSSPQLFTEWAGTPGSHQSQHSVSPELPPQQKPKAHTSLRGFPPQAEAPLRLPSLGLWDTRLLLALPEVRVLSTRSQEWSSAGGSTLPTEKPPFPSSALFSPARPHAGQPCTSAPWTAPLSPISQGEEGAPLPPLLLIASNARRSRNPGWTSPPTALLCFVPRNFCTI